MQYIPHLGWSTRGYTDSRNSVLTPLRLTRLCRIRETGSCRLHSRRSVLVEVLFNLCISSLLSWGVGSPLKDEKTSLTGQIYFVSV
jgi:hypothetical protein